MTGSRCTPPSGRSSSQRGPTRTRDEESLGPWSGVYLLQAALTECSDEDPRGNRGRCPYCGPIGSRLRLSSRWSSRPAGFWRSETARQQGGVHSLTEGRSSCPPSLPTASRLRTSTRVPHRHRSRFCRLSGPARGFKTSVATAASHHHRVRLLGHAYLPTHCVHDDISASAR